MSTVNGERPRLERARQVALPVVAFAAALFLAWFTNHRQLWETWLLWPYLGFWAATVVWVVACASVGHAALRLLPELRLRFRERLLFDFATGVLIFAAGLFVVGVAHGLGTPFYFIYPVVLGAVGFAFSWRDARRAWRHLRGARRRANLRPSLIHAAATVLGTLALAVIYLSIMTPDNAAFDARSYHLPIAEHFAAGGRIGPFPEGWFAGALPHLASWLYTWPFTLRSVKLFGHVELAAHLEFALFVATVFSAPLLVEALCPGRRARSAWAVFFLFPGLFLYDSSLGLAADHVLAFWAAPVALAVMRFAQRPSSRARGVLAGLMLAGAALTKYQAIYLLVPAGLVIAFIVARELWRARRAVERAQTTRATFSGAGALVIAMVVATAPHWLANVVWHGNPVYPMARNLFPTHPLVPGWAGTELDHQFELTGTLGHKLSEAAGAVFAFSFVVHDWAPFHGDLPVFGFLFTLTLPVLLFVRGAGRARVLAVAVMLGVFIWFWTYHEDRYLQALLPWMVATTSSAFLLAWNTSGAFTNLATRVGLAALVAVQLMWGNDVPWLPTHSMLHDVPAMRTMRVLSSTFRGDFHSRFSFDTGFEPLDRTLPRNAYVLLHEEYLRLGLNRRAIQDSLRLQAGIDYRQLARPDRIHDMLKSLGATHLVWGGASVNREIPISGELAFWGYALRYGEDQRFAGSFTVAKIPERRPPAREPGRVLWVACGEAREVSLPDVDLLVVGKPVTAPVQPDPAAILPNAEFIVAESRCRNRLTPQMLAPFVEAPRWGDYSLWVRRL
ncbi:MAG TPA: hypothetical protein VHJ20_14930 [Polyangia bacterium]|nr:hypothetical protein [Polyangia bacterium]